MDRTLLTGIALAATAATLLNVGKGIQKMKVEVLKKGRKVLAPENRRDFGIWFIGFLMTASASGFFSYSLKLTDKAGIVSATAGLGLVGLVIFAAVVLKERFGRREQLGALLVIVGTVLVSYFNRAVAFDAAYPVGRLFLVSGGALAALIVTCLLAWKTNRLYSLSFGTLAGWLIAISMVIADLALIKSGNDFIGQLANPYPYVAMVLGFGALSVTQLAFFRGRAMVVVPTINSVMIAGPPLIEYAVLGTALAPMQLAGLAVVVAGVIVLTTTSEGMAAR
ncbi:MAG: EamA family transporter [Deltaproteobacteria bacterium]|jgi:drug/metabolite transporter (DMT)-like permease|nr:EamA family transporter [Deltaproteobacteria bacterium]MBW2531185.1 EamA family transporter [Deltaproteobacteria bacterium]